VKETTQQKLKKLKSGKEVTTRAAYSHGYKATLVRIVDLKAPDNDTGIVPDYSMRYMAEIQWEGEKKTSLLPLGEINTLEWFEEESKTLSAQAAKFLKDRSSQ